MPKTLERGKTPRELLNLAERRSQQAHSLGERALQLLLQSEALNREAKQLIVLASIAEPVRGAA